MNINNYGYNNQSVINSDKFAIRNKKAENSNSVKTVSEDTLSDKQRDTLSKLREKYGNMDFYVVDSVDDENAEKLLNHGSNEYTVLMTSDELEKMASDDEYLGKRMNDLDEVMNMAEKLKAQYENESVEDENSTTISKFTVTFNDDGTTSYFVELEKMSAKQKERLEAQKEKKAEENKKAQKEEAKEKLEKLKNPNADSNINSKYKVQKTQIKANSFEELSKKIGDYYQNERMSTIKTEEEKMLGQHIDFSL